MSDESVEQLVSSWDPLLRRKLLRRLSRRRPPGHQRGEPNTTRTWNTVEEFLKDLWDWADSLSPADVPPHAKDFARLMARKPKTITRWIKKTPYEYWEGFQQRFFIEDRDGRVRGSGPPA